MPIPLNGAARDRLRSNLDAVRARVARAAERADRDPAAVRLLAVTKYVGPALAQALVREGQLELGESRVQELERKRAWFQAQPREADEPRADWHLIGHIQRNKARRACALAGSIHSVDSLRLLDALERTAGEEGARPKVYFELRLVEGSGPGAAGTPGAARTGLTEAELSELLVRARDLEHVVPIGLMTMGPQPEPGREGADPLEQQAPARAVFRRLAELRERLLDQHGDVFAGGRPALSMGMSSDLEAAVVEGSDLVRVGSALFEGFTYPDPDLVTKRNPAGGKEAGAA